ncbi:MAG: hypothetical protein DCC88_06695 [Spirobacillus cienkowskii]|jgi:hypothetical protein|uniref:Outer membrane protein beta-barrel domain-containing protein n=1 Tax=Spirobacillus cienkowskii TaxID=495820 RepID=A0A369KQG7_9BACT|nr:MAG: hypothetical protein DCC88_06695 [Spirobacillus cienkowskii]
MYFKKYFILVIFLLTTTQVIAKEYDKIGLNFFFNFGFSLYQNVKINNIEFAEPKKTITLDMPLGVLYELNQTKTGSLIIGTGLSLNGISYEGTAKINNQYNPITLLISCFGNKAYVGYKLTPNDRFSMYALGHLGYYAANVGTVLIEGSLIDGKLNIENYINYGIILINTFNLTNSFGMSLNLGFNNNSMSIENTILNINQKLNYTDVIMSLGLMYSI